MKTFKRSSHSRAQVTALVASLLLAGCGQQDEQTLRLGILTSTTGPLAEAGVAQLEAARLAAERINDSGGVLGKKLVLVVRDDGTDLRKAERAIDALLAEEVPVVFGTVSSALTLTAAERALPDRLMISASATSPLLTSYPDKGLLFRTCSSAEREGALLAQRARAKSLGKAAIIHRAGESEAGIPDGFAAEFVRGGGQVVVRRAYEAGQTSYAELLREVLAQSPDTVLLDADAVDGAQIVRDYLAGFSGAASVTWAFSDAQQSPSFVEGVGGNNFTFAHFGAGPGTPTGRRFVAFSDAYEQQYGEPPALGAFSANMYDAVFLAALAIEAEQSATSPTLANSLRQVSFGGRALGADEYGEAVQRIKEGADVNFEGASGSVNLDLNGDTSAPYDLWQVRNGRIELTEHAVAPAG